MQSFCLTPAWIRPQKVSLLLTTLNICVFTHGLCCLYPHCCLHLLICTFLFKTNTQSLPAPLQCTQLRSTQKGKTMVFPSCGKEHFQSHFSFGHSSRIFLKQIPFLADSLWNSTIQTSQVTGSVLLVTPQCLPWCIVLQQQGDGYQKPLACQGTQAQLSGEVLMSFPGYDGMNSEDEPESWGGDSVC